MKPPTPEQRRIAAERFERARQVDITGNVDYAVQLLLGCCALDPANLIYRRELRRVQKKKFKNNLKGASFAVLRTFGYRRRFVFARRKGDHVQALEQGEFILAKNPWDNGVQLGMAESADALGLTDVLRAKTVIPDADIVSELVAKGEVELGIIVVTQIMTTPGVELVGALPPELRISSQFVGGISTKSKAPDAARDLITFLKSPKAVEVMREQGMDPMF